MKQLLTEKKELDFNTKAKVRAMTQRNNHTEARMLLSKSMGAKKFVKFYQIYNYKTKYFVH